MEREDLRKKLKEENTETLEVEELAPDVQDIPDDDDIIQRLRNIRKPLSGAPTKPASGFIEQFEFYDDAGTMKLAVT